MDKYFKVKHIQCTNCEYKNNIHINKSKTELEKMKCRDIYWHLINNIQHTPKVIIT